MYNTRLKSVIISLEKTHYQLEEMWLYYTAVYKQRVCVTNQATSCLSCHDSSIVNNEFAVFILK